MTNVKNPGRYGDGYGGNGLSLLAKKRARGGVSKSWAQRIRISGKQVNVGLGAYPTVTLAEARKTALRNWRIAAQGRDPRVMDAEIPTFAEAAEKVVALHEPTWKTGMHEAQIWRSSIRRYALPVLGGMRLDEITPADVLAVLTPLWATKQPTAVRVRQRIAAVLRWSIVQGHRKDNPAGEAISQALPRKRGPRRHYRALPHQDVAAALETVRNSGAKPLTALLFEFQVLCAARGGEARLARWEEVDLKEELWTIPGERMKKGRTHRVPLSTRALEVLNEAWSYRDDSGLVFPNGRGGALSDNTLPKLMKDLGVPAVPHGFRASFRTWAEETTDTPRAVMESALAHRSGDAAEQAYARSDFYAKRKALMQAWADYLA